MVQNIVVFVILGIALLAIIKWIYRKFTGTSAACGCNVPPDRSQKTLLVVEILTSLKLGRSTSMFVHCAPANSGR